MIPRVQLSSDLGVAWSRSAAHAAILHYRSELVSDSERALGDLGERRRDDPRRRRDLAHFLNYSRPDSVPGEEGFAGGIDGLNLGLAASNPGAVDGVKVPRQGNYNEGGQDQNDDQQLDQGERPRSSSSFAASYRIDSRHLSAVPHETSGSWNKIYESARCEENPSGGGANPASRTIRYGPATAAPCSVAFCH